MTTAHELGSKARTALVLSVIATFALYAIPSGDYLAYPLMLISTVVHELGHGIAALMMGGDFLEFRMWGDGSGVAMHTNVGFATGDAFVAAGGLCGPAVAAAVFLFLGRSPVWARRCLIGFGGFLVLALVLWVRGAFGIVFVGGLAAVVLWLGLRASAEVAQIALVFLATQLALSVYSRGDYLFTASATTGGGRYPSDVQQMADALGGVYWEWGALCAAFSAAVLIVAGWLYLHRAIKAPRPAPPVLPA